MKKVFLIILNWNGKKDTLECLKSVRKMRTDGFQISIVVVDNGSTQPISHAELVSASNEILNQVQDDKSEIKILRNKKNLGFSEGNNVGIRYALTHRADYILLLNNDTLVDKNLINELLKVMEKNREIGISGPKIYFAPGFEYHRDRYKENERGKVIWYAGGKIDWQNVLASHRGVDEVDHGQYEKMEETDFISGCAMMVRREVFEKIGLLDPKYFLYYEDNDFCQRAKKEGFKIMYVPKAFLFHKNSGSAGGSGSDLQDYYTTRNRLLFGLKYAALKTKIALVRESINLLIKGRNWQKKGIRDFYMARFGEGTFGRR